MTRRSSLVNMKISDLTGNPKNPRTITDSKLKQLKKALFKFGDLSGVIFNRKTKHLVGGHQRKQIFDGDGVITISRKYPKPTKTGTVAEGFIELEGEKFSYREVYWEEHLEKAANIAANKGAGEWDMPQLSEWLREISDFGFDLNLTLFDETERADLLIPTRNPNFEEGSEEDQGALDQKKPIDCPNCGHSFILIR